MQKVAEKSQKFPSAGVAIRRNFGVHPVSK
jgi:hypothetical protein